MNFAGGRQGIPPPPRSNNVTSLPQHNVAAPGDIQVTAPSDGFVENILRSNRVH